MRRSGFSLVELMLVVAIVGILAAVAIPKFTQMSLKAKRAESRNVLQGVGTAETAYFMTKDVWVDGASNPGSSLTKAARAWDSTKAGWSDLGYKPDGLVRCSYVATTFNSGGYVRADAFCDVDDDNKSYILRNYVASRDTTMSFTGMREVDPSKY